MHWVLLVFLVLAVAGAVGCVWYRQRLGQEIALMSAKATSKAGDIARLAPGSVVEVKGTLRCEAPLTAEFSKESCVYFKSDITREITYYARKSDGKYERRTRNEPVHTNTRFAPCAVQDDSGSVMVDFTGADVEGTQVVHRREQEARGVAAALISVATGGNESSSLIYTETVMPKDVPIYVLGEVQANRSIGKPAEGSANRLFVISQKSEEQRVKDIARTRLWLLLGAIVLVLVAAVLGWFAYPHPPAPPAG
jgi:hypothetical protein